MTAILSTSADIPRDRYGRPLVTPPDGTRPVAYTRCTTFVDVLEDKYNLQQWEKRMVAIGLVLRKDLLLAVAASQPDDKKHLDDLTSQAKEAALGSAGATIGTALHALTERMDRGEEVGVVPGEFEADLRAYRERMAPFTVEAIEQFAVYDPYRIGGTPDRVVSLAGESYIADIKTGNIDFGALKIAMQLAVYSRSVPYDHLSGQRGAWPSPLNQERGLVIHLPERQGTCELRWIDISRGWDAVQVASTVRELRAVKNWYEPFDPLLKATTVDELRTLWPFFSGTIPLSRFLARKAELEAEAPIDKAS